jgi:hypothetical protein
MLLFGLAVHVAEAGSEVTVAPPTLAEAKTLFCGLREVESNATDQFMTALPPSDPRSAQTAPAGAPAGHETVDTAVVAGPGTPGGTAVVPFLKAAVPATVPAGSVSTTVTLFSVPTPVFVTVPLNK